MPVPQKKSRVYCFKRLLETIFSRPERPCLTAAHGVDARKARRAANAAAPRARILLSNCPRAQHLPAVGGKKKRSGQLFGVLSIQQGASHRSTRAALHERDSYLSFTAIPRCAPPDRDDPADCHLWVTTRRRSMDIRDATSSRRCRSSLFPASCATFRLDIFHFHDYNGYFQPPASGRSWGHLRMLLRLKKKVTR